MNDRVDKGIEPMPLTQAFKLYVATCRLWKNAHGPLRRSIYADKKKERMGALHSAFQIHHFHSA